MRFAGETKYTLSTSISHFFKGSGPWWDLLTKKIMLNPYSESSFFGYANDPKTGLHLFTIIFLRPADRSKIMF